MNKKEKSKNVKFKINNNILIGAGIAIVLLIILIIVGKKPANLDQRILDNAFNENKLIPIEKKGLYGFINKNGKEISKPQYDYVLEGTGKYFIVSKDGKNYIIDQRGKVKLESKTPINYDNTNDLYIVDYKLYNSNLNIISPRKVNVSSSGYGYYRFVSEDGGTVGILNARGKIVYKEKVNNAKAFYVYIGDKEKDQEEVYCAISADNIMFAIINCNTGKVVKEYSNIAINAAGNNIFYLGKGSDPDTSTIFIHNDKIVLEEKNTNFRYIKQGYIEYTEDNQFKYFDIKANKKIDNEPEGIKSISTKTDWEQFTGYTKMTCSKQYGLASDKKIILPCEYDKITFLPTKLYEYLSSKGKEYILGIKDGKTHLINLKNGKIAHSFDTTTTVNLITASPFIYHYADKNQVIVYNMINNREEKFNADSIDVFANYIKIHKEENIIYYNMNFKKIYETKNEK